MKPSTPRGLPAPRSNAAARSRNTQRYTQRLSIQNEGGFRFKRHLDALSSVSNSTKKSANHEASPANQFEKPSTNYRATLHPRRSGISHCTARAKDLAAFGHS